jgi:hypothetical protein
LLQRARVASALVVDDAMVDRQALFVNTLSMRDGTAERTAEPRSALKSHRLQ